MLIHEESEVYFSPVTHCAQPGVSMTASSLLETLYKAGSLQRHLHTQPPVCDGTHFEALVTNC
jgi:hypothetical protein